MLHMICNIFELQRFYFENTSFFLVYNIIMKSHLEPVTSRDKFYIQGSNLNRKMLFLSN